MPPFMLMAKGPRVVPAPPTYFLLSLCTLKSFPSSIQRAIFGTRQAHDQKQPLHQANPAIQVQGSGGRHAHPQGENRTRNYDACALAPYDCVSHLAYIP